MQQINNETLWHAAWLNTPMAAPKDRVERAHQRRDPDDLLDCPGVHVKTRERRRDGFPLFTGKLVSHAPDKVVVRSKPAEFNGNLKCIWTGDPASYTRMWTVD